MSTETTNKKIKIDNGTTFGKTYTDKAIDAKLPTDLIASANKLSLGAGNTALGNGVNLSGFTYDEATKTLKVNGAELPVLVINISDGNWTANINEKNPGIYNISMSTPEGVFTNIGIGAITIAENAHFFAGFLNYAGYFWTASAADTNIIKVETPVTISQSSTNAVLVYNSNGDVTPIDSPGINNLFFTYNTDTEEFEWGGPIILDKTISLFGKHSILVPKDSADTNIDMYLHSITIGKPNDTFLNGFTFLLPSSSNLVVDSIQDLNTILGTTPRMIPVSGCYNAGPLIIITRLNWKGSFANSTIITTGGEEEDILATFTSIDDKVTTL